MGMVRYETLGRDLGAGQTSGQDVRYGLGIKHRQRKKESSRAIEGHRGSSRLHGLIVTRSTSKKGATGVAGLECLDAEDLGAQIWKREEVEKPSRFASIDYIYSIRDDSSCTDSTSTGFDVHSNLGDLVEASPSCRNRQISSASGGLGTRHPSKNARVTVMP